MKSNHSSIVRRTRQAAWQLEALCLDFKKDMHFGSGAHFSMMFIPHFLSFLAARECESDYMPLWEEDERKRVGSGDDVTKFFRSVLLVRAKKAARSRQELDYIIALLSEKIGRSLTLCFKKQAFHLPPTR